MAIAMIIATTPTIRYINTSVVVAAFDRDVAVGTGLNAGLIAVKADSAEDP